MKRFLLMGTLLCCGANAIPQVPQSYLEFRQGILDDYQEFRRTILAHYADFLEGTWHEYETLMPVERDETPKPIHVPTTELSKPSTSPVTLPAPKLGTIPAGQRLPEEHRPIDADIPESVNPVRQVNPNVSVPGSLTGLPHTDVPQDPRPIDTEIPDAASPVSQITPYIPGSLLGLPPVEVPPEAKEEVPPTIKIKPESARPLINVNPKLPEVPILAEGVEMPTIPPYQEEEDLEGKEVVNFYGMEIPVPKVDFKISNTLDKASDLSRHWKILEEQDVADLIGEYVMPTVRELGLNDYLTYEFLSAYMDSKFPEASISPKMSAVHYILANQGYDVRIAIATNTGDPIILMPSDQMIYGKPYMTISGRNFFLMAPPGVNMNGARLATCDLPKAASKGKSVDMRINGLNLPMKERPFKVTQGDLTLSGVLNENLMPVVYNYPQMDTEGFAVSVLDTDLRKDLVAQLKAQLGSKDKLTATNDLLKFMQFGFDYATDDEFHGFEKPYFLEENFYYPKNDCEDRAIFFTYMLWNALGIENQLLAFPGHESAAVSIPGANIKGTSYQHEGKTYYISDPTYIGASAGQCMRQYETTAPTIDHTYPTL